MNPIAIIKKIGFIPALYKIRRRIFVNDSQIISETALLGAYDYLQKYRYVLDKNKEQRTKNKEQRTKNKENQYPNKLWTLWLQGFSNAPEIVRECVKSIQRQHGEDVVLLDKTNVSHYVAIPDYITDKWEKGIISNTHYSDIIRILLLSEYGGVWIDSTTYLFAKIPSFVFEEKIFTFQGFPSLIDAGSNWFIAAKSHNHIIINVKKLLLEYWKKENRLVSYSIFHLFFAMTVNASKSNKKQWKEVPFFPDINCKILQMELFDNFDAARLEQIKQLSVIQKLSYKFPKENFAKENTFYKNLLN